MRSLEHRPELLDAIVGRHAVHVLADAKRHADLRTVEAWQRSRRRRRMEIAATILLLAVTAAASSLEVASGPDRAAEFRAAIAESLGEMLPDQAPIRLDEGNRVPA